MEIFLTIIILLVAIYIFMRVIRPAMKKSAFLKNPANIIPTFKEIDSGFHHKQQMQKLTHDALDVISFHPEKGGLPAVMITGARGQDNGVLMLKDGRMVDVAAEYGLGGITEETAYGLLAADIDGDGEDEILVTQDSGVYVYSRNPGEKKYVRSQLDVKIPDRQLPLSIAAADTRKSGHLDLYISTYIQYKYNETAIFNKPEIRGYNVFLQNNGDGTFTDRTQESGLYYSQNNFMIKFVDLTGDGYPDVVTSPNTDRPRLFANNSDGTFTEKEIPGGYGFWMGIGVDDKTKSGLPDLFMTNVGKSVPGFLLKGDLRPDQPLDLSFLHLRNDGNYKFTDISHQVGTDTNFFGWGVEFADFANNGRNDLVINENYTAMPMNLHKYFPTPGKLMVQGEDGHYLRAEKFAGVENRNFGYRPLAVDLNGDGYLDLVIGNLGGPMRVFLNQLGG